MARNRKRRSAGRGPRSGSAAQRGVATANGNRSEDTPDPLEHAAPDVELAEAQLEVGRPEYTEEELAAGAPADAAAREEADEEERAGAGDEDLDLEATGDDGGGGYDEDEDDLGPEDSGSGRGRRHASTAVSAPREGPASRLVHFLQGSWRELQRVQWPDRRQVMQATGVVIGFVIVAGAFLGLADFAAAKIVKLILP